MDEIEVDVLMRRDIQQGRWRRSIAEQASRERERSREGCKRARAMHSDMAWYTL